MAEISNKHFGTVFTQKNRKAQKWWIKQGAEIN